MMNHIITEVSSKICDPSCVTFKACDKKSIQVNKYFLFLYNAFYRSILDECMNEGIVFIFEGSTLDDLTLLKEQIYQKHLQCGDHNQLSEDHQKNESNETIKDLIKRESDEDGKLQDKKNDVHDQIDSINYTEDGRLQEQDKEKDVPDTSKDNSSSDSHSLVTPLECPFNCDEVPDSDWTVDTLFAHIFSKHWSDIKNNFFVSIDTFIDKLSSELSSTRCALKCEKSKVYQDIKSKDKTRGLKTHYYRCHSEDPVICSNCGDTFKNSMTYSSHTRSCHVEGKTCDICNNGKKYKTIRVHMKAVHEEKKFECEVDGCKLRFITTADRKKHIKVVHKKEKPFVCDKCGIRMAQLFNLKDHRIKVHREGKLTFKEYKEMIRSGNHNFVPKESEIPIYMSCECESILIQ